MKFQTVNHGPVDVDNNLDHKLSLILETFFLFVHVEVLDDTIFLEDPHIFLDTLLDILDGRVCRYERHNIVQKLPVLVVYICVFCFLWRASKDLSKMKVYWAFVLISMQLEPGWASPPKNVQHS